MDDPDLEFLYDISKAIKQFYECPVIFLTLQDYSESIFNTMCSLRSSLQNNSKKETIDLIVDFHLQWMHSVNDVEQFKKRLNDMSREEVYQAISYTIDALHNRLKYHRLYMDKNQLTLPNKERANINADIEIIEDMHKELTARLLQKLKCFRGFYDDSEFMLKLDEAIDELLMWIDRINDNLSLQLSKYVSFHLPHLCSDLTKTLQQIINDLHISDTPSAHKILEDLKEKGREMSSMIRGTTSHSLEICKVVEKISHLEDRIRRLQTETPSAAIMALKNKKEFLENRLASIEKLKTSVRNLHETAGVDLDEVEDSCVCEDFYHFKIFNHVLPMEERERLVTELCYLWDIAVFGTRSRKSIVSILSAAENKEEFTDELGTFYIDEYSRKIYKSPGKETLYQPNEMNELVPLSDDSEHVFYFDECGRYFIDSKTRQRVYKAHATASEYMMDSSGLLLKTKEVRDGVVFHFDNFGRYYINDQGKNIYRESDAVSEYENDGVGNLVRIRSHLDIFELCPEDAVVTEDFKYLKQSVGPALRACIAQCILYQPADPIKYLSSCLIKFRENMEIKEKRARDNEELFAERELIAAEERAAAEAAEREAALLAQGGSECSYDSNMFNYTTDQPVDILSASSK